MSGTSEVPADRPSTSSRPTIWDRRRIRRARLLDDEHASPALCESLSELSDADNYYRWIASEMAAVLGGRVLELGAGSGTFTRLIAERADSVDALEPSVHAFERLGELSKATPNIFPFRSTLAEYLPDQTAAYDNAVLINVLEHIEDDEGVLSDLKARVRPGGRIAVWVPAHELLYSPFDYEVGHYRRYSRKELRAIALSVGLNVERLSFMNAAGAIAWGVVATLGRRRPTSGGLATFWDKQVVPLIASIEGKVSFPWGQSLLLIARVPNPTIS